MKKNRHLLLGAHTSTAGGLPNALFRGREIGATTVQIFTSNQKQWKGRVITDEMIKEWAIALEETGLTHIMSHDSYLINLGSPNEELLQKSRDAFQEELIRCQKLKIPYLNFHPGAAVGSSEQQCLDMIVESLLLCRPLAESGDTRLLLENTAGQGTAVGFRFEHLGYIIGRVKNQIPIGVCIDTCHAFAAGYDLRTADAVEETLSSFDREVGLKYLYAFHLNDSKNDLGSRVDRHANLGEGKIGWEAFYTLMTHEKTVDLPKYLETPGGEERWKEEIAMLVEYAREQHADKN